MSLLGIDIGTTGCKAAVFDFSGSMLTCSYKSYAMKFPGPGQCELELEEVWQAVEEVVRSAAEAVNANDPVEAIGISTLGDSLTLIDESGKALSGTVLGAADRRAIDQARWLEQKVGRTRLFDLTGAPLQAFCVIAKVLWFREHDPEAYSRAWKFCGLQEIVLLRLGLRPTMDFSLAGRTMLLDIRTLRPAKELYEEAGIDLERFFPVGSASQISGYLENPIASALSLRPGVAVVVGGFDQSCCALGAGVVKEGLAALSVGTLEAITPVFRGLRLNRQLLDGNHGCIPGLVNGFFSSLGYVTTSGAVLKWYCDILDSGEKNLDQAINSLPENPSGLFVFPYFAGSGTPWLDVGELGSILGLSLSTSRAQLLKGILEGISYELKVNIDSFSMAGIFIKGLRANGGGSRSSAWTQLKADILGVPIARTIVTEAGCLGAAFLAGLGVGRFNRVEDILDLVTIDRVFEPRREVGKSHETRYETYKKIRSSIRGVNFLDIA